MDWTTGRPAVFDCHIHLPAASGPTLGYPNPTSTPEGLLQRLERSGIAGGIVCAGRNAFAKTQEEVVLGNRELARFLEKAGHRYTGGAIVNPNTGSQAIAELEWCHHQMGWVWMGELTAYLNGSNYDSPEFCDLLVAAGEMDMVAQIHCDLEEMDRLAGQYPGITFVLPHFPPQSRVGRLIQILQAHPNLYFDICGSECIRMGTLEAVVAAVGSGRVMYGSDLPGCCPNTTMARVLSADLNANAKADILSRTCCDLLRARGLKIV